MRIMDLGELFGPVQIFGGPYSNLQATQALLAWADAHHFPPERRICTGDVVAYCANPAETVALIRTAQCPVLAGNCERQLARNELDCGCGFGAGTQCDLLSAGWYRHADRFIVAADRGWMETLPDLILFTHAGRRAAVIHGGLTDVSRFVWPVSDEAVFLEEISHIQEVAGHIDYVFSGHSGVMFQRRIGAVDWINAGAIGMPPHDGRVETGFAVLDAHVTFHRLAYDYLGAQAAMRAAGLVQGYDTALTSGYWPSEEVLPPVLRRAACANG
ncbi:metallophosphoesterase family protein [Roseovarius mucosus]|uniref:metallophosphoesterase family protein n=1 Tax=Roseovarius mucosus TaxID=215743 RepID=UPI0035D0348F